MIQNSKKLRFCRKHTGSPTPGAWHAFSLHLRVPGKGGSKGPAQLCLCRKRRPTFLLGTRTMRATLVTSPVSGARTISYCWISWEVKGTGAPRVCGLHPPPSSACPHLCLPPPSAPLAHTPLQSLPTHPCQQQLHLQLCNPAAQASPNPIAKGYRAKRMLGFEGIRLVPPQPTLGLEAVRLRVDVRVPGNHVVAEHKLGLHIQVGGRITTGL